MKKRILSLLLCLCMVLLMAPAAMATGDPTNDTDAITQGYIVRIGDEGSGKYYKTLSEAVDAVPADATATTITFIRDSSGGGVQVKENQKIVFDLNGTTYTVGQPTVGSPGTETNGFQLLKGSTVTFRDGTVKASTYPNLKLLIQNYCDLTLEDVTLDAREAPQCQYVSSNNFGTTTITGNTNIFAFAGQRAFDLWYGMSAAYSDGVTVTFDQSYKGQVQGTIEYGSQNSPNNWQEKAKLEIEGKGKFDVTFVSSSTDDILAANIEVTSGTFTEAISPEFCANGNAPLVNEDGSCVVKPTSDLSGYSKDKDGTYYVTDKAAAINNEAKIGTTCYATLEEAVEAVKADETITLLKDVTVDEGVYLVNEGSEPFPNGVTIDGGGHSITASDDFKKNSYGQINLMKLQGITGITLQNLKLVTTEKAKHALDVWGSTGVILKNVKLDHEKCIFNDDIKGGAPLIINQSKVTVQGTFDVTMGENSWYGINVDDKNTKGSASITFADGVKATFTDKSQAQNKAPIYVEEGTDSSTAVVNPGNAGLQMGENGTFVEIPEPVVTPPPANPSYSITTPAAENGKVTVSPTSAKAGAKVTITVTPDDGFELDELTVTRGSTAVTVTKNSDGTYSFTMPQGSVTVTATFVCDGGDKCPSAPFTDVNTSLWYHEEIDYVVENGLMNGDSPTTFAPQRELSRAELAQILYNKEGRPAVEGDMVFADVPAGEWFYPAILWANQEEVVGGDSPTTFVPNRAITREELAVMLYRYAGKPAASGSLKDFTDGDEVSTWAEDAMVWAVTEGIISGDTPTTLDPGDGATRAEAAAMLMRFCENVEQ